MIMVTLDRLPSDGVRTVFLWVLDGNDAALRVYERAGFVRTNHSESLEDLPGRTEELLQLDLTDDGRLSMWRGDLGSGAY